MSKKKSPESFFRAEVFSVLGKELSHRYYLKEDYGIAIGMTVFKGVDTDPLRSLLGYTLLAWQKKRRVSIEEIGTALLNSVVKWSLEDFILFVTQEPLLIKRELEAAQELAFQEFLACITQIDPIFVDKLTSKQLQDWFKDPNCKMNIFRQVAAALKQLPQTEYLRMPVFAYRVTGNSHAFDENQDSGRLLLQMLAVLSSSSSKSKQANVEVKSQLLAEFHLLRDDIMNFAAIRGLTAIHDDQESEMWRQACIESCSWNVPLKEILKMTKIRPFNGSKVLVVENSGVYSILVDLLPEVPVVCSSGQFSYAIWQLLRKLASGKTRIYYVGDLDPEGLGMAQRLLDMFPDYLTTIAMDTANFDKAAKSADISEKRLKQLNSINNPKLCAVADRIRETKMIALQEGFIRELIDEIEWEFCE